MIEINENVARKVLEVVDAGLVKGVGVPTPGSMCVEAAVCYAMGLPHGDDPQCVSRALRALKIKLNDSRWSSNAARSAGLRRLAVAQLGSRDILDDREFVKHVARLAITLSVPTALRAAASVQKDAVKVRELREAADTCEREGTRESVNAAMRTAANAAYGAAYAADAAVAVAAADAANAAYAAGYAADAAVAAANAAYAAANAAYAADVADVAADAADAVAAAAADVAARDKVLSDFAEGVVQILIDMKVPGCQWLPLTED